MRKHKRDLFDGFERSKKASEKKQCFPTFNS